MKYVCSQESGISIIETSHGAALEYVIQDTKCVIVSLVNMSSTRGLATFLIKTLLDLHPDISRIYLDDVSLMFRKQSNIYLKLGFHYAYSCGPEMIGSARIIKQKSNSYNVY